MKTVLISGSFDPVTRGHEALIRRAARLFDRVEVVIFENSKKHYLFTTEERLGFLRTVCLAAGGDRVVADVCHGTVAGYAGAHEIHAIVRGVRNADDLAYEQDMATLNRLACGVETLLLPTEASLTHISSSYVREFLSHGLPADALLPEAACRDILTAYRQKVAKKD